MSDGVAYIVDLPNRRSFSPDASYTFDIPDEDQEMKFISGIPVFAVEVRSEHDYGPAKDREYAEKRADYFAVGTAVVWDVDPIRRTVYSYQRDDPDAPIVFNDDDSARRRAGVAWMDNRGRRSLRSPSPNLTTAYLHAVSRPCYPTGHEAKGG